ncbi:MAG TPA: FAD-dependent oxidoreductase [Intrasporangium sp.]|nr:FAD-dependent oxidoreductase [Intrasporangium sp.]
MTTSGTDLTRAAPQTDADVLVVGAGPAGLACTARLLAETDLSVTLVDAGHDIGGQYWRQPAPQPGSKALGGARHGELHHDLSIFHELRDRVELGRAEGRAEVLLAHHVWAVAPAGNGYVVHAVDRGGPPGRERGATLRGRALVIATGAFDRSLPFPGWDLPGVMTAGGLQALLKAGDVAAGRRIAVGGSGPFLLPVAASLAARRATVVGVFEANPPTRWLRELPAVARNVGKLGEGAGYAASLLRHRVPVRTGRMIVAAHGTTRVEAVTVARLDRTGRIVPGSERPHEVDAVGVGWGFTPQLDLAVTLGLTLVPDAGGTPVVAVDRLQRASRPQVYAAGETCGVGGAALAVAEGRLAAAGIAVDLAGQGAPKGTRQIGSVRRLRAFAAAIMRAHPVPAGWADALRADTVVCRCEEVTCGAIRAAIADHGAADARQVKQLTRAGMGWCQGRVCGFSASMLTTGGPGEPVERLVSAPVPLGVVAQLADPAPDSAM